MRDSTRFSPRPNPWAWLPSALGGLLALALVIAVAIFLRVLFRLREPLALTEKRMWMLAAGFVLIEAFLGRRAFLDGRRAWQIWRRR